MDYDNNEDEYEYEEIEGFLCLQAMLRQIYIVCSVAIAVLQVALDRYFRNNQPILRGFDRLQAQIANINRLVRTSDETCKHKSICIDFVNLITNFFGQGRGHHVIHRNA